MTSTSVALAIAALLAAPQLASKQQAVPKITQSFDFVAKDGTKVHWTVRSSRPYTKEKAIAAYESSLRAVARRQAEKRAKSEN